jgi:hypothetical protein
MSKSTKKRKLSEKTDEPEKDKKKEERNYQYKQWETSK